MPSRRLPDASPYTYTYSGREPLNGLDPRSYTNTNFSPPPPSHALHFSNETLNHDYDDLVLSRPSSVRSKPMASNTKRILTWSRWTQFLLRSLHLIGAIGLLVCAICFKNLQDVQNYALRVPPCVDILSSVYAIYHLLRSMKSRPATMAASYHFFALLIDAGLIPFYVFTALYANAELDDQVPADDHWTSFWSSDATTDKLILSTWLLAIIVGGLHLIAFLISCYLVVIFRKIANLPPDMNPLEDNLTTRPSSRPRLFRHSKTSSAESILLAGTGRFPPAKERVPPMSFVGTSNIDHSYSTCNPSTATELRRNIAIPAIPHIYSQPQSTRAATVILSQQVEEPRLLSMKSASSYYSDTSVHTLPPLPRKSSKRKSDVPSDIRFVHKASGGNEESDPAISIIEEDPDNEHIPSQDSIKGFDFGLQKAGAYSSLSQDSSYASDEHLTFRPMQPSPQKRKFYGSALAPLSMNPPTPPLSRLSDRQGPFGRALRRISGNDHRSYSGSTINSAKTIKSRFYGDLGSAMRGVKDGYKTKAGQDIEVDLGNGPRNWLEEWQEPSLGPDGTQVISSSGADVAGAYFSSYGPVHEEDTGYYGSGLKSRNVSGKIAEEGRGGI